MKLRIGQIWFLGITFGWGAVSVSLANTSLPIKPGLKEQQVLTARGQPYYQTENYTTRHGEQVWLYTKSKAQKTVNEKKIMDEKTHWLTLYRKTTERTCQVGDIFVEMSQGIVHSVMPANENMAYGPCVIETTEEFLPIVNGKPTEIAARKASNTVLEGTKK